MSIKSQGGVFGRNPTFNDVTVDGDLSIDGTLTIGGETITGLSYQGGWNASTNTPDIAASSPVTGQFWIVSADGSTDVGGITNWTQGDWALYDGSNWQRVEGGNTDLSTGVQGQLAVSNGGTGAADAATARTNLGLGTAATTASTDYATAAQGSTADSALQPGDIGSTVQGYDADTAKYDDTTANFTGTLQNGGSNVVVDSDIGSTVQGYDADTAKLDVAQTWTATQTFSATTTLGTNTVIQTADSGVGPSSSANELMVENADNAGITIATPDYKAGAIFFGKPTGAAMGRLQYNHDGSGGYMRFFTNNSEAARFTAAGHLDMTNGHDGNIILASGSGIDFSATAGTGTSELFDDYEEGTFTPTVEGATTAGSGTYGNQLGYYTKVGRVVHFQIWLQVTSHTGTGTTKIMGLPFTSGGTSTASGSANLVYAANLTLSSGYVATGEVQYNGDYVVMLQYPTTGTATSIGVPVDGNMQVKLAGSYMTA